jgi:AraC-like DNA-binding protein
LRQEAVALSAQRRRRADSQGSRGFASRRCKFEQARKDVMPISQRPLLLRRASLRGLCQARDLIREFYTEPVSLEDCAHEAGISAWHLLRSFRAVFGETPKEFHTRLRIEQARHLLTVTDRSVTDVCFDVGFSSLGTFSVLFKREVGCSPKDFRRKVRCWVTMPGYSPWVYVPSCFAERFGGWSK